MIRPVGVDDLDFGDGRIALLILEIPLAECDIRKIHGKVPLFDEGLERAFIEFGEALEHFNLRRGSHFHEQRASGVERGLTGFDGVDDVAFDGFDVVVAQIPGKHVDGRGTHGGTFPLAHQLDAFAGGLCALVELPRKIFDGEHARAIGRRHVIGDHIALRLAEDRGDALAKQC